MLNEANVQYTFEEKEAQDLKMLPFHYEWKHTKSSKGGEKVVYCFSDKDAQKLVEHWSSKVPDLWTYNLKT